MITLPFLSGEMTNALSWVLAHSLWQGALAVLVPAFLLPRLKSAQSRYRAAYLSLMLIPLAALCTFYIVYDPAPLADALHWQAVKPAPVENAPEQPLPQLTSGAGVWLEAHSHTLVWIWMAGFLFFLSRMAGGLWYLRRLRRRVVPASSEWQSKLQSLAQKAGFSEGVVLATALSVRMPLSVGWLKPLIIFPTGLLQCLTPDEAEAVLAHELAHLMRRDWLFNLLQAFVEAMFYYHPGVWWISGVIRAERENCCDDMAIAFTGKRMAYAQMLVRIQENARNSAQPAFAMSAAGANTVFSRRRLLLARIQRILHHQQHKSLLMERLLAAGFVMVLLAFLSARAHPARVGKPDEELTIVAPTAWSPQTPQDTVPKSKKRTAYANIHRITEENDGKNVEMEVKKGQVARLVIDGKEIPPAEYEKHKELTERLLSELPPPPPPPPFPPAARAPRDLPAPPDVWTPASPAPPAPPAPPAAPPAPVKSLKPGVPALPPPPAAPPAPRKRSALRLEKSDDGHSFTLFDPYNEPMEIKMEGGQVWVNGQEMRDGDLLEFGDRYKAYDPLAGLAQMEELQKARGLLMKERQDALLGGIHEQQARLQALQHNRWEEINAKQAEKMRLHEKNALELQGKALKMQGELFKHDAERQALELEGLARLSDGHWKMPAHDVAAVNHILLETLMADGLISDPDNYSVELSLKHLKINGKKQSEETLRKYLERYARYAGKPLVGNDKVQFSVSR